MYKNSFPTALKRNQSIALKDNTDEDLQKGLAKLVLIVVDLLRQILERQAKRRVEGNQLSEEEIERLGVAFMRIKNKIEVITNQFGIEKSEIERGLSSMVSNENLPHHATIVDLLDRVVEKEAVIAGTLSISVADIDLVVLNLLASITTTNNKDKREKSGDLER